MTKPLRGIQRPSALRVSGDGGEENGGIVRRGNGWSEETVEELVVVEWVEEA